MNFASAAVVILTLVEVADLPESRAVCSFFGEDRATPRGVVAPAGAVSQFNYLTAIARARQFVSRSQPADPGAQDDYRFADS